MSGTAIFRPAPDDFVAVSRGTFLRSLTRQRLRVRLLVAAAIGAAGGLAFDWVTHLPLSLASALIGAAAMLAWLALILFGTFLLLPRRSRRLFRQQKALDREFIFAWTDAGVTFSSDVSRSMLAWKDYHDWFETDIVFGFGLNEQLYHWVPKRALDSGAITDLRHTARERLTSNLRVAGSAGAA